MESDADDLTRMSPVVASRILFNIFLINEFEKVVLQLKADGCVWGPIHVSIGQEAVAAASVAALRKTDKITGSHRAHHQFISKAMHFVVDDDWNPARTPIPDALAEVVRKTLAEVMGLAPGYCGGRGGSMHLRYEAAGVLGTNAIVGGGIPLATGAAFAEKALRTGNVVVCYFGDGAINQGAFHEACNLAGLWRLPIVYFVENNLYAVGTHVEKASAVRDLSVRGASYNMDACVVDGCDAVAIYETVSRAVERARRDNRPCLVEAKCYRHYHHKEGLPGSVFGYRDKAEEAHWLKKDAMTVFAAALVEAGILAEKDVDNLQRMAAECVAQAADFCTQGSSPYRVREELWPKAETATVGMRSDGAELDGLEYKERCDFADFKETTYAEAISAVTGRWLERDEHAFVLGEEVANFGGGAFGANKGLPEKFGDRMLNTPISEAGFVGLACGAAMRGMRPVVEIMFPDFSLVAADQLFNQIGKARHMYGNTTTLPIVVRTRAAAGTGYGGQHSMDGIGLFALFAGWRIVAPADAFDYIGLFNTAMHSLDPVLIVEYHSLYEKRCPMPKGDVDFCIPFGKARVVREGRDVTILSYGVMTERLRNLEGVLSEKSISAEIIDLRSLDLPSIDYAAIARSIAKTGAVMTVEEAPASQSIGPRIAAKIAGDFLDDLDASPKCLASADVPPSVSRVLERAVMIHDEDIITTAQALAARKL